MSIPTYSLPVSGTAPNQVASKSAHDAEISRIITELNASLLTGLGGAIRTGGPIQLINVQGTGDAATAEIAPSFAAIGISGIVDGAEVAFTPLATNAIQNPTINADGQTRGVRRVDGSTWPAGAFVANRPYVLRRVGSQYRVVRGDFTHTEQGHLRTAIQLGAVIPLTGIGGTGDEITANIDPAFVAAGITSLGAASEVEYIPITSNASSNPTISIGGTTYGVRRADGSAWAAGRFLVNRVYKLRRFGSTLRVVAGDVQGPEIDAQFAAETQARNAAINASAQAQAAARDLAILAIQSEDRRVDLIGSSIATMEANTGAAAISTMTVVLPQVAAQSGTVERFRAQVSVPGILRIGIYREIEGELRRVRYRDIGLQVGFNDVGVLLPISAGDRVGWFLGNVRIRRLNGGGSGYFFNTSAQDLGVTSLTAQNTSDLMLAQAVLAAGTSLLFQREQAARTQADALDLRLLSQEAGRRPIQRFGMTDMSRLDPPQADASLPRHRILNSVRPQGEIVRVECWSFAATNLRLTAYTQINSTGFQAQRFITVPLQVGWNVIPVSLQVSAGEYIGIFTDVAAIPSDTSPPLGVETSTWSRNADGDLSTTNNMVFNGARQVYLRLSQAIGVAQTGGTALSVTPTDDGAIISGA